MSMMDYIHSNFAVPSPGSVTDKLVAFFSRMRTGEGVPQNGLGNDGDFYFDVLNGTLYAKSSGAWTSGVGSNVSAFNTRTGNISLSKTDVTGTGITASDVGAVSRTGGGAEGIVAENCTGVYTFDLTRGNYFVLTATGDTTFTMPTVTDGNALSFVLHLFNPNNYNISWASSPKINWLAKQVPNLTPSSDDILSFLNEGDHTNFFGLQVTAKLAIGATYLDITASAEPPPPQSGVIRLWYDLTQQIFLFKDSLGNKRQLGSSAPAGGVITQVVGQLITSTNSSANGSFSLVLPSTPTSGNDIIVAFGTDYGGAITAPAGWTVEGGPYVTADGTLIICRLHSTGIVGDKTATFTFTGSHFCFGSIAEYAGMVGSPLDKTATNSGTGTSISITTAATAVASELAIAICRTGGLAALSNWGASGFATVYDSGAGAIGAKPLSSTGAVTASPTYSSSLLIAGLVVTYKGA